MITKGLAAVDQRLAGIEAHPALRLTPEQHQQAVARAGSGLLGEAVQTLDRAAQDTARERHRLGELIGTARTRGAQRIWLLWTAAAALAAGLVVSPFAAALLPFGGDGAVAAMIMKADRWDAGIALMRSTSPDGWRGVVDAANLVRTNQEALRACGEMATRTRKEQRCTITVPVQ